MFKKKPGDQTEKVTRQVVKEVTEKRGGVETTTTTITCTKDDFGTAFKRLDLDPIKFQSGGTSITRQIIYTNSSGDKEILEETVETFDEPKGIETTKSIGKDKSFYEKLGLNSSKSAKPGKDNVTAAPTTEKVSNVGRLKPGQFEKDSLEKHNEYRRKHGVPNLKLCDQMCAYSKEWADHLAATDSFKHRSERNYGENIYMKWSSDPNHMVTGAEAVDSWYSEIKDYTFGLEPRSHNTGHFTQVIWKGSKQLGVAWARSKSGKILVVANYDPAGNFVGRYVENVPPPKK